MLFFFFFQFFLCLLFWHNFHNFSVMILGCFWGCAGSLYKRISLQRLTKTSSRMSNFVNLTIFFEKIIVRFTQPKLWASTHLTHNWRLAPQTAIDARAASAETLSVETWWTDETKNALEMIIITYRKVASSRPVYYSIFDHFWGATNQDVLLSETCYYYHVQESINW